MPEILKTTTMRPNRRNPLVLEKFDAMCTDCPLCVQANTISDSYGPLSGLTWRSETDESVCRWAGIS
jgi:hypothetical protein